MDTHYKRRSRGQSQSSPDTRTRRYVTQRPLRQINCPHWIAFLRAAARDRLFVAGTVSSQLRPEAAPRCAGPAGQGRLPASIRNSRCRPSRVARDSLLSRNPATARSRRSVSGANVLLIRWAVPEARLSAISSAESSGSRQRCSGPGDDAGAHSGIGAAAAARQYGHRAGGGHRSFAPRYAAGRGG